MVATLGSATVQTLQWALGLAAWLASTTSWSPPSGALLAVLCSRHW
jgi:hypothetical protein